MVAAKADPQAAEAEARGHLVVRRLIPAVDQHHPERPGRDRKEVPDIRILLIRPAHLREQPSVGRFEPAQFRQGFPRARA